MNPILINIGSFEIHWYSIILLISILLASLLAIREAKRMNFEKEFIFNLIFWTVIIGIIGARLYYVLFNWELYSQNLVDILKLWQGGLAIHGGLIAGFITVVVYTRKHEVSTFKLMDIMIVPVLLAQAIGRWGNFFNMEAHGAATTIEHLRSLRIPEFIINGMEKGGIYYTPTFLYESLWCLLGFILLLFIRRLKYIKVGQLTSIYFIWYGIGRFFIEVFRTDSLMLGGFKAAQIISIIMIASGIIAFMIIARKTKYEDLYNE